MFDVCLFLKRQPELSPSSLQSWDSKSIEEDHGLKSPEHVSLYSAH